MTKTGRSRLDRFGPWLPAGAFLAGLMLTSWFLFVIHGEREEHALRHFDDAVFENLRLADQRIASVRQLLRAAAAAAAEGMSPEAWENFVRTLGVEEEFPGVLNFSVTYLDAPGVTSSIRGFTSDLEFEAVREARDAARDRGGVVTSVRLPEGPLATHRPIHSIHMPIYQPGMPTGTLEERRAAHAGWVDLAIASDLFLRGIFSQAVPELEIRVYDGPAPGTEREDAGRLMYRSSWERGDTPPERLQTVPMSGRSFTIGWSRGAAFQGPERWPVVGAGIGGLLISLLVAGLLLSRQSTRRRADRLAERRTHQLRESEDRFRTLSAEAPVGIFHTDESGRCLYVNRRYLEITGLEMDAALESDWRRAVHPDDIEAVFAEWRSIAEEGRDFALNLRFLLPGEEEVRWGRVRVSPVYSPLGETIGFVGSVEDITERLRIEEQRLLLDAERREAQRLEGLGLLAGGVAHEFNNILTGIVGNASLARDDLPAESPIREQLLEIEEASERGAELCRQMLAYSGRERATGERLDLSVVVAEVLNLLRLSTPDGVRVTTTLADDLPAVAGNGSQLRQVVMSLGINGAESIGAEGGTITIETGVTDQELPPELPRGEYVFLEVTDTGRGMSPETQARIFDPFFSTKFMGRGLGLAAVRGVVNSHRGALSVRSRPGEGATFRILLPAVGASTLEAGVSRPGAGMGNPAG